MTEAAAAKAEARREAERRRAEAHAAGQGEAGAHLLDALAAFRGRAVAGYWPMRTEIDPRPAMAALANQGPVALPVVVGPGRPLLFRRWTPGAALVPGVFGTRVPGEDAEPVRPEALIVPLLAFTDRGERLGYGGGFYDRTLAALRAEGGAFAVGFAFAAQRLDALPLEPTDEPLDLVATEMGIVGPRRSGLPSGASAPKGGA